MQINKSDRNDAAGIGRIKQTGWFKEISVKDLDSHSVRALLASLALLVKINQIRGLLKNLGLAIGRPKFNVFAARAEELIEDRPELIAAVGPLTLILAEMLILAAWHGNGHLLQPRPNLLRRLAPVRAQKGVRPDGRGH